MKSGLAAALLAGFVVVAAVGTASAADDDYGAWVEAMKTAPRGPFRQLRWFCNDGAVLPPERYACREHGGGYQHGQWSDRTVSLRAQGYKIANVLAGVDAKSWLAEADFDDTWSQILIERFLIAADDGWIMRRALFYRGAIQEEDERAGARSLLSALSREPRWVDTRYAALRAGARLLPHGETGASAQAVRQESAALDERDPDFARLRAKIHGAPDAGDAARVRDYATAVRDPALRERYLALADQIDALHAAEPFASVLAQAASAATDPVLADLVARAAAAADAGGPDGRYGVAAGFLAELRDAMPAVRSAGQRLLLLRLSLRTEEEVFAAGSALGPAVAAMSRTKRLALLRQMVAAAYGAGLLKKRERASQEAALAAMGDGIVALDDYLDLLRQLGRVPGWGTQNLRFLYFDAMKKLAEVEPKAMLFIQDQLRGSPLLLYAQVLDGLSRDANRIAGVRHRFFGRDVGVGLKALNPGLAIGTLHAVANGEEPGKLDPHGIYLLPETVSDLPPIAGILTGGEGNPLSHVQLLARNLGIPNVSVDDAIGSALVAHDGERVVLAVSAGGLVQLDAAAGAEEILAGERTSGSVVIRPEPDKLALDVRRFIPLDDLRATDSGVLVGPKAAKLGELKHAFPETVAPGVAIPFGLFKAEVLDRPYRDGKQTVFDWMLASYGELATLAEPERAVRTEAFRAELHDIVRATQPSRAFRKQLRAAMRDTFGSVDEGVFIRSDTNVEDLPGFTGAGLNLTLPNVVGFDALLEGIPRVWASPFTQRAYAWRQAHMENPQHVYTSVLLLRSVASDNSGVLVTQDLESGARDVISVAVNEGLGGAVDGQAAESLRIDATNGTVRLLATATAPWKRRPAPGGGIESLPASGADAVLGPAEIERLVRFVTEELPARFPPIVDDQGEPTAADIEFGFKDGALQLFQLRPFLQNRGAAASNYLIAMDRSLAATAGKTVDLSEIPAD